MVGMGVLYQPGQRSIGRFPFNEIISTELTTLVNPGFELENLQPMANIASRRRHPTVATLQNSSLPCILHERNWLSSKELQRKLYKNIISIPLWLTLQLATILGEL